jgi:hypothetical protein
MNLPPYYRSTRDSIFSTVILPFGHKFMQIIKNRMDYIAKKVFVGGYAQLIEI